MTKEMERSDITQEKASKPRPTMFVVTPHPVNPHHHSPSARGHHDLIARKRPCDLVFFEFDANAISFIADAFRLSFRFESSRQQVNSGMSNFSPPTDTWCQYLPDLHRTLAEASAGHLLPRSYLSLNFAQSCAWWETLRYLLRRLVGWQCIPAGLAWWYEAGKPHFDDVRLRLILDRWDTRQELDFFAAREWESRGWTGSGEIETKWSVKDYEPCPGWLQALSRREPFPDHGPYGGGSNPLHLSHSDEVGLSSPIGSSSGHHDTKTRQAVLIVSDFSSWVTELTAFGASLPSLGDRSWNVEVFDRRIGFLGLFRQSRVTSLWFQGKHSIHIRGNPLITTHS